MSLNNKLIVFFAGVTALATLIYTLVAGWTLSEIHSGSADTHDLAVAGKKTADTSAVQLELAERPWIDASITLDGPFSFSANGASVPLKIALRNTGHSPAMAVVISPLGLLGHSALSAVNYREQVCNDAARISTTMPHFGVALFPDTKFEQRESVAFGKEEIENGKASKQFHDPGFGDDIALASVLLCIAYRPTFSDTSIYHTAYIVDLLRLDSENRPGARFTIGRDVDRKHLLLQLGAVGPITAD